MNTSLAAGAILALLPAMAYAGSTQESLLDHLGGAASVARYDISGGLAVGKPGIQRFDGVWIRGQDWMISGDGAQVETGLAPSRLLVRNVVFTGPDGRMVSAEGAVVSSSADISSRGADRVSPVDLLLSGTPANLASACTHLQGSISALAGNATFETTRDTTGSVALAATTMELFDLPDGCRIEAALDLRDLRVAGNGKETHMDRMEINVTGPLADTAARQVRLEVSGLMRTRNGSVSRREDVTRTFSGKTGAKVAQLLDRMVHADMGAAHELADMLETD